MLLKACTNQKEIIKIYLDKKELENIKLIKHSNFEIKFKFQKLKYKKPKHSPEICILKSKSYLLSLYTPITIKYKKRLIIK